MVMGNDIHIAAILQTKTAGYGAQPYKAKLFIKMQRAVVGGHHRIKLQNAKAQFFPHAHAVGHQMSADVLPTQTALYRVAGVADVTAAPNVVGVQNIQPHHSPVALSQAIPV